MRLARLAALVAALVAAPSASAYTGLRRDAAIAAGSGAWTKTATVDTSDTWTASRDLVMSRDGRYVAYYLEEEFTWFEWEEYVLGGEPYSFDASYRFNQTNLVVSEVSDLGRTCETCRTYPFNLSHFQPTTYSPPSYPELQAFALSSAESGNLRLAVAERHNYWWKTGRYYDERRGNVTVFELVDGSWLQLGNAIVGEPDEALGLSLSFSDDGTVLAIGCDDVHNVSSSSYFPGSSPEGFVRVFKYDSGTWTQLGDKIVATGHTWDETETNLDVCSISGDGRSIVVHSMSSNTVQVFRTRTTDENLGGSQWELAGEPIDEDYAWDPSLNYDGTRLLMAGMVFELTHSSRWSLSMYTAAYGGYNSNGISSDGTRAVIIYEDDEEDADAHVVQFDPRSLEWVVIAKISTGHESAGQAWLSSDGSRVSISHRDYDSNYGDYVGFSVFDVGDCDYASVPNAERADPPSCASGEVRIWGSTAVECAAGALLRACRPRYSWGDREFCPVWAEFVDCEMDSAWGTAGCAYEYEGDGDYGDADGSRIWDFVREVFADSGSRVMQDDLECGNMREAACGDAVKCEWVLDPDENYCSMTTQAVAQAAIDDGAPASLVSYLTNTESSREVLSALRASCHEYVDFDGWSDRWGDLWVEMDYDDASDGYPDDGELCAAMHDYVECRAAGDCDPYVFSWYPTVERQTLLHEMWADSMSSMTSNHTKTKNLIDECSAVSDEKSCDTKAGCVFAVHTYTHDQYNFSYCWADSAEVLEYHESDGASEAFIAMMTSLFWDECWALNEDACAANPRCGMVVLWGFQNRCALTDANVLAVAAAGCRSHESFDDVAETWGVDLREAVAARFPGACVSPPDPENGEHATSCPFMLTGETCSVKCDEGYAKQSGSLVSRCADGAYAPAVCASAAATPAVGANGGAPPTTPTTADVDAKKADASEKRAAADEKRAAAEDIRDDLLTSVADAKDRRLAEVLANAALAGAASVSVVRFPLAADDEDAACDDAFATMRVDAAEGACDVSLYGSGRRLLATYDVSVYLDPARVNATALEAAVQNLRDEGLAPATETSDPVAALASIPGIDSGLLATFETSAAAAVEAEAAAAAAEDAAEAAEEALVASELAPPPPPTAGAVAPPPPKLLVSDYESSARRTASAALAVLAAFVCAAA